MDGWKNLGAVVSDPWPGKDSEIWNELLGYAAHDDAKLYVKLIGLRFAGAELKPDARWNYRLVMANDAVVTAQAMRELLAPHGQLLINFLLHLGGGAGGQQKTDT